jgi:Cu2+-containing amine oxidase
MVVSCRLLPRRPRAHDLRFDGRPVVHRAFLGGMAVPYVNPRPSYTRKCAFDVEMVSATVPIH